MHQIDTVLANYLTVEIKINGSFYNIGVVKLNHINILQYYATLQHRKTPKPRTGSAETAL
jgi:hypothetical protein